MKDNIHHINNNLNTTPDNSPNLNPTPPLLRRSPKPLPKTPRLRTQNSVVQEHVLDQHLLESHHLAPQTRPTQHHFSPASPSKKPTYNFDHIKNEWKDNRGNKAEEEILRLKTVDLMTIAAQKELAYLRTKVSRLKSSTSTPMTEKIGALFASRIQELSRQVSEYEHMASDWASSNYFRDIFRGHPRLKFEYSLLVNKYLPLPVNMRIHTCKVFNQATKTIENSEIVRLGVVSDMSNGFTNLKELKQIEQELKKGHTHHLLQLQNDIIRRTEKELKKGHHNVFGAANYALSEVKDLATIQQTLEKRRQFLITQALPLVLEHAKKSELDKIDLLKMIDVRLLNHKKQKIDPKTGWFHNETNELLDMAEIFKELSDKVLICDGQGPFIDEQGNIHLPQLVTNSDGSYKKIAIFAAVVNHSVQGHTKNDGASHEVNLETYSRLVMKFPNESHMDIAKVLMKKKTSYATAVDLIDAAHRKGYKISTGCLSAKDRTGFVCAAWVVFKRMACFSETYKRKVIRKQLNAKYPAVKVVLDNTGAKRMKLGPFFLPGVTDDFAGIMIRIGTMASTVIEILKENARISMQCKEAQ